MQKQDWCTLYYIDAFAGRGKQVLKSTADTLDIEALFGDESERADTKEFLIGSAIRALRASAVSTRQFNHFVFIDVDRQSCHELKNVIHTDFPEIEHTVDVQCGDANTDLCNCINGISWKKTRALVFLDPCGLEVDWNLIRRLAETRACDVWYLFPLGGVIRMMTKDGQIPDVWRTHLDRVFGTCDWYDEFYKPDPQQSLFAIEDEHLKDASTQHVVDYVRKRLNTIFASVSEAGVLRNSKGAPLFALVLGVSNPSPAAQKAALKIANHLVKELSEP